MREKRGWTQEAMAGKLGTTQNTISRLENPRTGKPTIKTLLRIARVFDVGLLVRFVPFGFYGDVIEAMDTTHVEVPSYCEELAQQEDIAGEKNELAESDSASAAGLGRKLAELDLTRLVPPPCQGVAIPNGNENQAQRMGFISGNNSAQTMPVIHRRFPASSQNSASSQWGALVEATA